MTTGWQLSADLFLIALTLYACWLTLLLAKDHCHGLHRSWQGQEVGWKFWPQSQIRCFFQSLTWVCCKQKVWIFSLFLHKKHMLWVFLEEPLWGTSIEYAQHLFLWRNKKNKLMDTLTWCYVWLLFRVCALEGEDFDDIFTENYPFFHRLVLEWTAFFMDHSGLISLKLVCFDGHRRFFPYKLSLNWPFCHRLLLEWTLVFMDHSGLIWLKFILLWYHWGVQLILAYSWARPAILVTGKGRGGMFLFLLFLHFHSCSAFFPVPLFHLFYCLFYLFSPFLWETTQNDSQGLTCR